MDNNNNNNHLLQLIQNKTYTELHDQLPIYSQEATLTRTLLIQQNNAYKDSFKPTNPQPQRIITIASKPNTIIKLSPSVAFKQNFYCYPIKENLLTESNYILPYYEQFNSFSKFNVTVSQLIQQIDTHYHFHPKTFTSTEHLTHKMFFIWVFIRIVLSIRKDLPLFQFNAENCYLIIKSLCTVLNKNVQYVYKHISDYTNAMNRMVQLEQYKPMSIAQYRKAFCQICSRYLCRLHYYNEKQGEYFHELRVLRVRGKKMSGDREYVYKGGKRPGNSKELHKGVGVGVSGMVNVTVICEGDNAKYCKHKVTNVIRGCYGIEENHFDLFKSMKTVDFYILNCILNAGITTNSCLIKKVFHNSAYHCYALDKIIRICYNVINSSEITAYLSLTKYSHNIFPSPALEKRKTVNDINDNSNDVSHPNDIIPINPYVNSNSNSNNIKTDKRMDYIPCDHIDKCSPYNCQCVTTRGYCEKFCICNSKGCEYTYKGCNCTDGCILNTEIEEESTCLCIHEERECDPEICRKCCSNGLKCSNTKIASKIFKKTAMAQSTLISSAGLFANEDIEPFDLINEYIGQKIVREEFERRSILDKKFGRSYGFELTPLFDIDAIRAGNVLRYVNHGLLGRDNCYARVRFVRGENKIVLFAKRKIKKGEELLFNYNMKNAYWIDKYNKECRRQEKDKERERDREREIERERMNGFK